MLLDANLLLYAVDRRSPYHAAAGTWLVATLNGARRVGLPWQTIGAFLRIVTHPRITTNPLPIGRAWDYVDAWLSADPTWVPPATDRTTRILGELITETGAPET